MASTKNKTTRTKKASTKSQPAKSQPAKTKPAKTKPAKTTTTKPTTAKAPPKRTRTNRKPKTVAPLIISAPGRPTREEIAARAYELWERAGCQHGHHEEHWLAAEAELGGP